MLFISELPVWLLLAQANCTGLATMFVFICAVCAVALKCGLYKKQPFEKKSVLIAAVIAMPMGIAFFDRWIPSSKVARLAGIVHMPTTIFMSVVTVVLAVASICGILNIIGIVKEFNVVPSNNDVHFNTNISNRTLATVFTSCLLIILPLLIIGIYNRPSADDFSYARLTHEVV